MRKLIERLIPRAISAYLGDARETLRREDPIYGEKNPSAGLDEATLRRREASSALALRLSARRELKQRGL